MFTDAYPVAWPNPSSSSTYFYPGTDFQVDDLYNAHPTVESHPPHSGYVPTPSPRDPSYGHYGTRRARYPESSQRTPLDDSTTPPMYHFTTSLSHFPPNGLRGPTRGDADQRDDSLAAEAPAVDSSTPRAPLSSSATFVPRAQFQFRHFYSDPYPPMDAPPVDTSPARAVSAFVDPVESAPAEFNPGILPLIPARTSTSPSPLYRDQNARPAMLPLQMGSLPIAPVDDSDTVPPFGRSSDEMGGYRSPDDDTEYNYNSAHAPPSPPLRTPWSESSLSTAFREETSTSVAHSESNSPSHSGSECSAPSSESQSSRRSSPVVAADTRPAALTTTTSLRRRSKKKKKCKMHECDICHKQFPRPSGLTTHQNSHSGNRPFKCGISDCPKSFAVRSNARRHLRTHGIFPDHSEQVPGPCFAGFNPPIVSDSSHHLATATTKLKWMPQSLSTRTDAALLKSQLDEKNADCIYSPRPLLSAPLPPVLPSFPALHLGDEFEERNSFADAGSQPYHPAQWRVLPGPAIGLRTTQASV